MAISVADNFSYQGTKPLDARIKFDTVANMKAASEATLYDGCFAYVTGTKKYYSYDSSNTVDTDTGKWREYSSGNSEVYLESSTKTTASGVDTFSFSNAAITITGVYDFYADVYGVAPTDVVISTGSMQVKFRSGDSVTKCRVYIKE